MAIYLGLDLGTSELKGTAINDSGQVLASFSKQIPLISRQPDWVEQSPEFWWSSSLEILNLLNTKIDNSKVKAIGLSGQMHGLVTYNHKLSALRRAIIWADKRSTQEVEHILNKIGRRQLYRLTANPVFTGFLLPSLLWLKRHEKEIYKQIHKISSPKDYLAFKLTDNLRSEPTDSLATACYDYKKDQWSSQILKAFRLKQSIFPEIKPTLESYGGLSKKIAKITGIPSGTPVYGGSDQSMAAIGTGLILPGQASIAISTGGQFLVIAPKGLIDPRRRLHTLNHALPDIGLYMAATLSASLSLRWFKDQITQQDCRYPEFLDGIKKIPPGCHDLFFLPFLAGERTPYFNPNLKASFFGLSITHKKAHLCRAIMEGVAFSMKDCLEVFNQLKLPIKSIILCGGGSQNPIWRQILVNVLNRPMTTINITNHSPFGAAVFAKFAQQGLDKLPQFYRKTIKTTDYLYPHEKKVQQYQSLFTKYKQLTKFSNHYCLP